LFEMFDSSIKCLDMIIKSMMYTDEFDVVFVKGEDDK